MIVLLVTVTLRAPWVKSLKDKRALVRPLMHRLQKRFNLACAESGLQDVHTQIELSMVQLAFNAAQAESMQQALYDFAAGATEAEIIDWIVEYR